jgi:hypothetical protein
MIIILKLHLESSHSFLALGLETLERLVSVVKQIHLADQEGEITEISHWDSL